MSKASPGRAPGVRPNGQRLTQAEMAERLERALGEVKGLVVNTDSDGLLAGVVLAHWAEQAHGRPLPVVGFYDTQRLWLDEPSRGPDEVAWIDVDLRVPGATVVSQHIVTDERIGALREPPADVTLIDPNHLVGAPTRYRSKYPFSATAWAWALAADREVSLPDVAMEHPFRTGLLWAEDGGARERARGRRRSGDAAHRPWKG